MKAYEEVDVQIHSFLTSALDGRGQLHAPAALSPGKSPWYTLDRRVGGTRAGPDMKKRNFLTLPGLELRPIGRRARSQ
jgi:hypothetical protein